MGKSSKLTFIVDISKAVGRGHYSRCQALYEHLLLSGVDPNGVTWILVGKVETDFEQDFPDTSPAQTIKADSNGLMKNLALLDGQRVVIDLPGDDFRSYQELVSNSNEIFLIVDRPVGKYDVNVLIAPNLFLSESKTNIIESNLEIDCLIGPEWFPLRPEFYANKKISLNPIHHDKRIKVGAYFGGLDAENQMKKVYESARALKSMDIQFDLIAGSESRLGTLEIGENKISISYTKSNFLDYMKSCDFFIGSLGVSAWERCLLAIPTITSFQNDDQVEDYKVMKNLEAIYGLGHAENYSSSELREALEILYTDKSLAEKIRSKSLSIMIENELKSSVLVSRVSGIARLI